MKPIRFRWVTKVLTVVSLIATGLVHANNKVCVPQLIKEERVADRGYRIQFPDGREIQVIGHAHGIRQINDIIDNIYEGKFKQMSNQEFTNYLKAIKAENSMPKAKLFTKKHRIRQLESLSGLGVPPSEPMNKSLAQKGLDIPESKLTVNQNAIDDFKYILESSEAHPERVRFIGFEGFQSTWNIDKNSYVIARNEIIAEFNRRGGKDRIPFSREQLEEIILSASKGNVYFHMINPTSNIRVVGTEDEKAGQLHDVSNPIEHLTEKLEILTSKIEMEMGGLRSDGLGYKKSDQRVLAFESDITVLNYLVSQMDPAIIKNFVTIAQNLRKMAPIWATSELEDFLDACRNRIKLNSVRDYYSAQTLAAQGDSGIHFVGLNHLNSTVGYLSKLCRQEEESIIKGQAPNTFLIGIQ